MQQVNETAPGTIEASGKVLRDADVADLSKVADPASTDGLEDFGRVLVGMVVHHLDLHRLRARVLRENALEGGRQKRIAVEGRNHDGPQRPGHAGRDRMDLRAMRRRIHGRAGAPAGSSRRAKSESTRLAVTCSLNGRPPRYR